MIEVTDAAAKKIKSLVKDDQGLRVKVVGGGCSGLTYKIEIGIPTEKDKVFGNNTAKIIVDKKSFLYLNGMTLDYSETLMSSGFSFINPNVKRTCGCGTSFSV